MKKIIILVLLTFVNIMISFPGTLCIQENVFNFNHSSTLTTSRSAVCLSCLFNGEETNPGTKWLLNGQIITPRSVNAQVNDNGTLVFLRQPGTPVYMLTCQNESTFTITLKGELCYQEEGLSRLDDWGRSSKQHHQCYKQVMGDLSL